MLGYLAIIIGIYWINCGIQLNRGKTRFKYIKNLIKEDVWTKWIFYKSRLAIVQGICWLFLNIGKIYRNAWIMTILVIIIIGINIADLFINKKYVGKYFVGE